MPDIAADFDVVLYDIEGTVCPISFVKDVLFPYALAALPNTLDEQWDSPDFRPYRNDFPTEYRDDRAALEAHVRQLIADDIKVAYLKSLQGYLWQKGYDSGEIKAPLFPDVAPFLKACHTKGKRNMIYSSGSVPAQKLLFGHTDGDPSDLRPLIADWFDTVNAGPKPQASSYQRIMKNHLGVRPDRWLFLSDNVLEVKAAIEAGMHALPVTRPGNEALNSDWLREHKIPGPVDRFLH